MKYSLLESSILKTLSYADVFNATLTFNEIYRYLISNKQFSKEILSKSVTDLVHKNLITEIKIGAGERKGSCYHIIGQSAKTAYNNIKAYNSFHKLYQTVTVSNYIKMFSSVEAVLVTGSVSRFNGTLEDDIDLLVITKPNTLWKSRLGLTLLTELLGRRRYPNFGTHKTRNKNKFCLNMYLDTDHLVVPKASRNLYTAHEVVQARPLFSRNHTYEKFMAKNGWVKDYLPHSPRVKNDNPPPPNTSKKKAVRNTSLLEQISYNLQKRYMNSKITNETIDSGKALFHPRKTSEYVMMQYEKRLLQYGL